MHELRPEARSALAAETRVSVAGERHRGAWLILEAYLIKLAREGLAGEPDGHWRLSRP